MTMDTGIHALQRARRDLDKTHKAACAALVEFDLLHDDPRQPAEDRLAARSLRAQTLELCEHIRAAMNAVPEAAVNRIQESDVRSQKEKLPCTRTTKSLLDEFKAKKRRPLAASVNYGHPIAVAISCLLIAAMPLQSKAQSLEPKASRSIERVIDALVQIESSGRSAVTGDNGKAVGLLQLHPVAVSEANRIAGSNRWKLSDRLCPQQSRAMARTILTWHYRRGVTDPVDLACRWNKPFGQTTAHYRAKVKATLAKI